VPLWARSRAFLGPVFVATATATGAAATRLALVAGGLPEGHPTRRALGTVETAAIAAELGLAAVNERRLGRLAAGLHEGRAGALFGFAKGAVRVGLALRLVRRPAGPAADHAASALYLAAGLAFRYAWVEAGKTSARDDDAVALAARDAATPRSPARPARTGSRRTAAVYAELVRRVSLGVEALAQRRVSPYPGRGHQTQGGE
jgi:hypothetical protein